MKRILYIGVVVFLLAVIVNLSLSLWSLWSKKDLLVRTKERLAQEQQKHQALEKKFQEVSNPSFVEEEARNKLFLGKPGESLVIFPTATQGAGQATAVKQIPVWLQWIRLFFTSP